MAECNLNYYMGILAVIYGYMIGSAVAEPNDEELNNKLEISVTIQKRTNAYGTTLLAYLMLNILVIRSSWLYWIKKKFIMHNSSNFEMQPET